VEADAEAAFWLFRAAATQAFPPAEYNVGRCYERGIGVAVSLNEASLWYYKAARAGHDAAIAALAQLQSAGA
jgi:TPR repeat protein